MAAGFTSESAGWTDIALIEREVLTAGSSWHAAGGFHALNADPNIAALQSYTIDLFHEIERESGQSVGMHMTGGYIFACTPERWEWLQSAYRIFQTMGHDDVALVSAGEIKRRVPIVQTDGIIGGMYAGREGYIDPSGVVHAYAKCARQRGADIIEHNRVVELRHRPDGTWDVVTEKGTVHAEHVVNAAGLWAKQCGLMAGIDLPVMPLEHHYMVTEAVPELQDLTPEMPTIVDLDGCTYLRQEQKGILLGIYERNHQHWNMDGAPWDYGIELIEENTDRIADELLLATARYPVLENVGVKRWVNGAFTFSPDGNPLVGPVRGVQNYWVACGVMAGFLQGGGVGKSLAEWMVHGEPEADVFGMDIARYGTHSSNREYVRQTTGQFYSRRFAMTYPNEQLSAGRPLKTPPAYSDMTAAGARWGCNWGLEVPLYFAEPEFKEEHTVRRSSAFSIVAEEVSAVRRSVGLLDISGYSRFEVTGPQASHWLNKVLACKLPRSRRCALAPMLGHDGRLKGDLTVFNWGDGTWWLMGSYYLRQWHMRWFESLLEADVDVKDISDAVVGLHLAGPNARSVLRKLTHCDVSNDAFKRFACETMDIGLWRVKVARMSLTGEIGYEINCRASEHIALRQALLAAGKEFEIREFGFNAANSMRLEKSYGIWSREFTQGYTPAMTGLDRFIDFNKTDFVGREGAFQALSEASRRMLATLEILDDVNADPTGYEPVWKDGNLIGHVTSGGFGHTVGKSLALALIDGREANTGNEVSVHVVGQECVARVIDPSPYDPSGSAMRS